MSDSQPETVQPTRHLSPYLLWPIWFIWIFFFTPGLLALYQMQLSWPLLSIIITGVILFIGVYLWGTWRNVQRMVGQIPQATAGQLENWLPIAIMSGLSLLLPLLVQRDLADWFDFFILTSAYTGSAFKPVCALQIIIGLLILNALLGLLLHFPLLDIGKSLVFVLVVGIVVIGLVQAIVISRELRAAREEIARLAVMNERLRIARDLHDLLGHNLSLITLKSELAGRLLAVAPTRAAKEIQDIEQVARTTLQEVREAVSTYRQPTLASELEGAQEILAAAGISYRYHSDQASLERLPTTSEAVLAWAIREGITNVIRHGRAQSCSLQLIREKNVMRLEILNDCGQATPAASSSYSSGNGLRGLAERVDTLGGTFAAGRDHNGNFLLSITVPLTQKKSGATTVVAHHSPENDRQIGAG
ncbi:sensor histidine kinase [Dictyobacter kobayashii]|uniref:Signal transduction histidine kinase subgroup 3 dimerisation and phosphoacceptor domain-containing protein n=1 Tax=Dictyobacter kobayashii TaxID=2014872 RepID=A0A402ABP3_9CHLR|nr:sensor histidine kinase [Dictyobacter kobayashii]GCE16524.1 hypothetical protein KDK_03240 [Dictyobacter kobayashii]